MTEEETKMKVRENWEKGSIPTSTSKCPICKGQEYYDTNAGYINTCANVAYCRCKKLRLLNLPKRFDSVSFEVADNFSRQFAVAMKFTEDYVSGDSKGLALFGSIGTGKTYLLACVLRELAWRKGIDGQYVSSVALMENMRRSYNLPSGEELYGFQKHLGAVEHSPILALDDIGVERPSEWVREQFYLLINHRYENKLSLLISSNYDWEQLEKRLGERIVSRLVEMCEAVIIKAKDRRKVNRSQSKKESN